MAHKICSILFFGPGGAVDEKNCKVNPVTFVKNHISSLSPFILSSKYQFQNFSVITFSGSSVFVMAFSGFSEEIKTWDIKKIAYGALLQKTHQYFTENNVAAKDGEKRTWKRGNGRRKREKEGEICFRNSIFNVIKHSEPSERVARRTCERPEKKILCHGPNLNGRPWCESKF